MSLKLVEALSNLKEDEVLAEVTALREGRVPFLDIIQPLQEGMRLVGDRFQTGQYFLSELIMASYIFKKAVDILGESFDDLRLPNCGTFLLGTIFGDVHDIGKNIVATVLRCNGFKVVDLGVNVPIRKFIEAIEEHQPDILGISCLLTTVFDNMKAAIKAIEDAGLRSNLKILIGGGPVNQTTCHYVGADAFGTNAQEAVELSQKIMKGNLHGQSDIVERT